MKTLVTGALLVLSVTLAAAPKAVLPEREFSFGKVLGGETLMREFILKNEGMDALRITRISLTEPMRLAKTAAVVSPGSQTVLTIQLPTANLEGLFEGELRVGLNDPALPEAILKISAEITASIEISPRPAIFVVSPRGQAAKESVEILNHAPEPLRILGVEHPEDHFTTQLETIEEGQRYRLTVYLKPDGPGGRQTGFITLRTNSNRLPKLSVLAGTFLRERVYTFPERVDFGAPPLSAFRGGTDELGLAQTLMVYRPGTTGFKVQASTDNQLLVLSAEPGPQGDRVQITVALAPGVAKAGPVQGTITLQTNDAEFPVLRVQVTGRITDR